MSHTQDIEFALHTLALSLQEGLYEDRKYMRQTIKQAANVQKIWAEKVAGNLKWQGAISAITGSVGGLFSIGSGVAGFGDRIFGWTQKTMDAAGKIAAGIGSTSSTVGETANKFMGSSQYSMQAHVDEAKRTYEEATRFLEDCKQEIVAKRQFADELTRIFSEIVHASIRSGR